MSQQVLRMIGNYTEMIQERSVLLGEIATFTGLKAEEIIEAMNYHQPEGERVMRLITAWKAFTPYAAPFGPRTTSTRSRCSGKPLRARGGRWAEVLGPAEILLTAVNQELAAPQTPVADGDEVAIFPPVTGG